MALVKRIDFGNALGVKDGTIRSKISRKQLCCNKKGLIDTENPKNYAYLLEINGGNQDVFAEYDLNSKTNVQRKVNSPKEKPKKVDLDSKNIIEHSLKKNNLPSEKPEPQVKKPSEEELSAEERKIKREEEKARKELLDYDMRKKKADAEYRERESELKRLQLEKIAGNTLPLDLSKKILQINCQAILIQFLASLENMVTIAVEELGGDRADNVRITNALKTEFKQTVVNCKANAEREIEIAVAEYSDVRSRGERK